MNKSFSLPQKALVSFFIGGLAEKINLSLFDDLFHVAKEEFGERDTQVLFGIQGVAEYLKLGKNQSFLLKMNPDLRKVVEAMVEELDL